MTVPSSDDGHPRMPQMPEFPPEETSSGRGRRRGGFLVVLFAVMTIVLILGAISVVSVGFTIVLAGAAGFVLFHYLVWGWWLSKIIIEDEESDDEFGS